MGKVKFSFAVAEIRNKVGGVVYSKNRYGNYVRDYVIPADPNTPAQQDQRTIFRHISEHWKELSEEQREQWRQVASSLKKTDIFGNQYSSNGFQFYMQINTELSYADGHPTDTPPTITALPFMGRPVVTLDLNAGTFIFDLVDSEATSNQTIMVLASPLRSTGVTYFKNIFARLADGTYPVNFPLDIFSDYEAYYEPISSNMRIGWQVYMVDTNTGLRNRGISGFVDTGIIYNPIAAAYFEACPTQPSLTRKDIDNNYIIAELSNSIAMADIIYFLAAEFQDNSPINVIQPGTYDISEVGSPPWSTLGYEGNGLSSLNTNWQQANGGNKYSGTDGWIAIYCSFRTSNVGFDCGASIVGSDTFLIFNTVGAMFGCLSALTETFIPGSPGNTGMLLAKRVGGVVEIWYNGIQQSPVNSNAAFVALATVNFYIMAWNNNGSIGNRTNGRYPYFAAGGGDIDAALHYTNTLAYLTAIGAD